MRSVASFGARRYTRPSGFSYESVPWTASIRFAWARTTLGQVGESESSGSTAEARRAGVERVDHHLPVGGTGDFDVAFGESGRRRGDQTSRATGSRPSRSAGRGEHRRIQRGLAGDARLQQAKPRGIERAVQPIQRHERQGFWRQDPHCVRLDLAGDLDLALRIQTRWSRGTSSVGYRVTVQWTAH